jgi:hypothetical protein
MCACEVEPDRQDQRGSPRIDRIKHERLVALKRIDEQPHDEPEQCHRRSPSCGGRLRGGPAGRVLDVWRSLKRTCHQDRPATRTGFGRMAATVRTVRRIRSPTD